MREVSISQLWSRAWDLFKGNWLLLVGLLVLYVIENLIFFILIPIIGNLIVSILLWLAFVRAGYLVARQGQLSPGEVFGDISLLLKVFVYDLILGLIRTILIVVGYIIMELKVFVYDLILGPIPTILIVVGYIIMEMDSAVAGLSEAYTEDGYGGMSGSMALSGTGGILLWLGYILILILNLFGWAGPYAILSGRAGIFSAIGQSFSLTAQNFGTVFLAFLLFIGLAILGLLLCGVGLLVVIPMLYVFMPLLYFALTGEERASHS
jgi:hypothetical protein